MKSDYWANDWSIPLGYDRYSNWLSRLLGGGGVQQTWYRTNKTHERTALNYLLIYRAFIVRYSWIFSKVTRASADCSHSASLTPLLEVMMSHLSSALLKCSAGCRKRKWKIKANEGITMKQMKAHRRAVRTLVWLPYVTSGDTSVCGWSLEGSWSCPCWRALCKHVRYHMQRNQCICHMTVTTYRIVKLHLWKEFIPRLIL